MGNRTQTNTSHIPAAFDDALSQHAERVHREGDGVVQLTILYAEDGPGLVVAAAAGDPDAQWMLEAAGGLLRQLPGRTVPGGPLCLTCDNEISHAAPPAAVVIMRGLCANPTAALGNPLCNSCCARWPAAQDLRNAVLEALRRSLDDDLRVLPPFGVPGRA